ncbi:TIGR04282 family arsenosugar biosynthesis glycosyltransferase [Rubrivirga sp. S365]|uniref:TIGR04282 family arsenosugar biosynthesis glycosyltransferase n=1 Tax=Rubrivirga litoralis TaxID=3075598 RepID=A0ABU3BV20_9BACT|nr:MULTISPECIES: TIGR04282 family arsenosugar biosynthesis glycosyltransferase [unclassified Rubrivirga]MDT0633134.1 TIGR04282 family arsenosugar biosynthesis glycosyltransferase [Rubrivirga sp. F394]MDT7857509.1 TIGR04282 family arsenosugar biosynthesis glycosyltransferase [Rubrivirga sp. S365]
MTDRPAPPSASAPPDSSGPVPSGGAGRSALLVFAKVPEAGRVKTRLCPPLAPEEAAALYDAFLRDALDRYAALGAAPGGPAVRLYLTGAAREPAGLVPPGVSVHPQRGRDLGERMLRAFVETFAAGYGRAVVVGTDHPTLPDAFFGLAFEALEDPMTAVIGPSSDGGYYLLGLNEVTADLFDMAYSHDAVFEDTLARVMDNDLTPVVLPAHYDVDDGDALDRLVAEWRGGAEVGPRTARLLQTLAGQDRIGA